MLLPDQQLKHIRRYLDFQSAATLVHSFVTRRVDYCNGLLAAAPVKQLDQLQRVLNAVVRLLLRVPRSDISLCANVRDRLHWLRMPERVTFKLCTTVYKCLHGMTPGYLNELCVPVDTDTYRRHLRSTYKTELKVPRNKLSTYGPRAFGIAGPTEWNYHPCHLWDEKLTLEQFTSGLKSHFFRVSYNLHVAPKSYPSGMSGRGSNVIVTYLFTVFRCHIVTYQHFIYVPTKIVLRYINVLEQ